MFSSLKYSNMKLELSYAEFVFFCLFEEIIFKLTYHSQQLRGRLEDFSLLSAGSGWGGGGGGGGEYSEYSDDTEDRRIF